MKWDEVMLVHISGPEGREDGNPFTTGNKFTDSHKCPCHLNMSFSPHNSY